MKRITTLILLISFVSLSLELSKRETPIAEPDKSSKIEKETNVIDDAETNVELAAHLNDDDSQGKGGDTEHSNDPKNTLTPPTKPSVTNTSIPCEDSNCQDGEPTLMENITQNKEMLMRTFYVLLGVTSVVIVYFVFRAWRIRRRRSKSRKYGLITTRGSDLEMAPLDQDDDDDDDMTVFEINGKPK